MSTLVKQLPYSQSNSPIQAVAAAAAAAKAEAEADRSRSRQRRPSLVSDVRTLRCVQLYTTGEGDYAGTTHYGLRYRYMYSVLYMPDTRDTVRCTAGGSLHAGCWLDGVAVGGPS